MRALDHPAPCRHRRSRGKPNTWSCLSYALTENPGCALFYAKRRPRLAQRAKTRSNKPVRTFVFLPRHNACIFERSSIELLARPFFLKCGTNHERFPALRNHCCQQSLAVAPTHTREVELRRSADE